MLDWHSCQICYPLEIKLLLLLLKRVPLCNGNKIAPCINLKHASIHLKSDISFIVIAV